MMQRVQYKWIVAAVFVTGMFMDIMDVTIVNVAIPALAKDFNAAESSIEWVVLGYVLSLAVWIPASGWVGDRVGTKKTFLFALFAFTAASALCGQAHSIGELIAFRVLQGVGGGMLTPVGTAMLFRAFPPSERAKASTVLMLPAVLAPALGPVVGGWLVTDVSWRWIFYVNLPIGLFGFVFGLLFLKENREPTAGGFDLAGFLLSGGGLALVLFSLSEGPRRGWTTPVVMGSAAAGLGMFVALVMVELRIPEPMLDLRLFRDRMFRNSNIILLVSIGGMIGTLFLLPLLLQSLRGLSALQSGLATFPQAIGMMIAIPIVGRLYPRVGPKRLVLSGLVAVAAVSAAFIGMDLGTNLWWIRLLMLARGAGMAFSFIPLQASTYANISKADTGRASALYSTQRQVGGAIGVAVLATVWISRTKALTSGLTATDALQTARLNGFRDAFWAATIFSLIAACSALLIRDKDAASTLPKGFGERRQVDADVSGQSLSDSV
jgi:EmrB/QacA subfamily drug resistance transporter